VSTFRGIFFSSQSDARAVAILRRLAVNYLFLTNEGLDVHPELIVEPFNARTEQNDYEVCCFLSFIAEQETHKGNSDSLVLT
jgi:hypothetical protein